MAKKGNEFNANFVVKSKSLKENVKGEGGEMEIKRQYHAYLMSDEGYRLNLHSELPLACENGDEFVLKGVKLQQKLKE